MKIALIIPAYNEERRIGTMLDAYISFFAPKSEYEITYIVVLNGCRDKTIDVVKARETKTSMIIIDVPEAGKGFAIKRGFQEALRNQYALIGFVDADMATQPEYFENLITNSSDLDGIIASRYMKESRVYPARPKIKAWGRKLIYEPLIRLLFRMNFHDYQCGAKLFHGEVIQKITPSLTMRQWAFDVELLYLCHRGGFKIREVPTVWYDQADSKLKLRSGITMLSALFGLWWRFLRFGK